MEKFEEITKENNEPTPFDNTEKENTAEQDANLPSIDANDYKVVMRPKKSRPTFVPSPEEDTNEDVTSCLSGKAQR